LTLVTPSVLVTARSAVAPTVLVAVELLFELVGSLALAGADTVAVLLMLPVALPLTVPVAVNVAVAPLFRLTVALMLPEPLAGQLLPAATGETAHVHVTPVTMDGKVSATVAPVTALGPLFVTRIV
jgi:hypothetical protein